MRCLYEQSYDTPYTSSNMYHIASGQARFRSSMFHVFVVCFSLCSVSSYYLGLIDYWSFLSSFPLPSVWPVISLCSVLSSYRTIILSHGLKLYGFQIFEPTIVLISSIVNNNVSLQVLYTSRLPWGYIFYRPLLIASVCHVLRRRRVVPALTISSTAT